MAEETLKGEPAWWLTEEQLSILEDEGRNLTGVDYLAIQAAVEMARKLRQVWNRPADQGAAVREAAQAVLDGWTGQNEIGERWHDEAADMERLRAALAGLGESSLATSSPLRLSQGKSAQPAAPQCPEDDFDLSNTSYDDQAGNPHRED